jgi:hypothetical protein
MTTEELLKQLKQAEADLAFALAQGDGYAEDAAADRIAQLESWLEPASCEGHPAGPYDPMGETVYCDGSCQAA